MRLFKKFRTNSYHPLGVRGTLNLTAPRNYSEMSDKQIRYVARLQRSGQPEETIWTKCLIRFTGIKPLMQVGNTYFFVKKKWKGFFSLTIEEVAYFSKKMDFVTKHYSGIRPVQKILTYRACDELLRDTIFSQYLEAENYYQAYLFTQDEQHLGKLIATLYQTGKKYDNTFTEKRGRFFTQLTSELKKLITIMWMMGVKEYFSHQWPDLFERTESGIDDEEPTAPDMYAIIQNQVRLLTEGDITKRDQVLKSNTWDALEEMNAKVREAKEMKKMQTPNP